ncbi:hypothetical protein I2I11_14810 [Pontibacter sp. 172403-2]|uniref:hypothetical protein n=1 Tax=Pontibacter rufus TaxID=2791028 RepID=UPI0018AFA830|nr:hypothetical protein [Pontibacter sp. 172403-2]MBF9254573.1 hypothetical protein [Pontibacter sp. 172403-2]
MAAASSREGNFRSLNWITACVTPVLMQELPGAKLLRAGLPQRRQPWQEYIIC